jgi:hypothetical protein
MLVRTACLHLHAHDASVLDARGIRDDHDHGRIIGTAIFISATSMLECLDKEIRSRLHVVRIFRYRDLWIADSVCCT